MFIAAVNRIFTGAVELLILPFKPLPPIWSLLWLSFLSSLLILFVFRLLSSPSKIRRAKDLIKANILAIRIYRDQWVVILRSFTMSLWHTLRYFLLNLLPLAVVIVPLFFLFVQMDIRYGYRPFAPGETTVLKVKVREGRELSDIKLIEKHGEYSSLVEVNVKALSEKDWKVKIAGPGYFEIDLGGERVKKSYQVGEGLYPLSLRKYCRPGLHLLLYPAEKLCKSSDIEYISLKYPHRSISFLGVKTHWLVWYLLFVLIIVLALRKTFGVEF